MLSVPAVLPLRVTPSFPIFNLFPSNSYTVPTVSPSMPPSSFLLPRTPAVFVPEPILAVVTVSVFAAASVVTGSFLSLLLQPKSIISTNKIRIVDLSCFIFFANIWGIIFSKNILQKLANKI